MTKYETENGSSNWLRLTHKNFSGHQESELLQEFAVRWATRLSYAKVSELVSERSGTSNLSDQRIYQMVEEKAGEIINEQREKIKERQAQGVRVKAVKGDIYDAQEKEIMWFADGICVCEQKAKRDKVAKKGKERVTTEMAMLEQKDGKYRTIIAGEGIDRVELYEAEVIEEYGQKAQEIAVVVVTDGARSLKKEAKEVFGGEVNHILDWYHLESKVCQLMTQIAASKKVKLEVQEMIINELWRGESEQAIKYLAETPARNQLKKEELLGYLEKNKGYLINYEKRQAAKKVIGSRRMEKQNDVIVAHRQKRKGMSWSKKRVTKFSHCDSLL